MTFDDPELVAQFIAEAREHLGDVEGQFLQIEAGGQCVDVNLVNTVFRSVHSIKGAAGFLGLTTVSKLAHSLENVLGKMRTNELVPTSSNVDVMLKAADALNELFDDLESSNDVDVSPHVEVLDKIFVGECGDSAAAAPAKPAETSASAQAATPQVVGPTAVPAPAAAAPQAENSIRVQVGVLDRLMNLAGELVLGRNQLMQTIHANDKSVLDLVAARLDQVTTELQEAIMRTRMQPIGAVFNRFPRVVRDLSSKLGKQCDIVIDGKDVEVDKTILEAIGDPLTHLVRNSIDHGVERPDVRAASGKQARGTVTLRAYHQAGQVRIDVADDGAGIDATRLRQKAVEKGVITAEQASRLTDRETLRLIFHPGFSTAEEITDLSGRGVGMDVVRTNIEMLGGSVDIESIPTQGTTIQITLPLTLAIIPSLIVGAGNECFVVPQVNVLELVRVRAGEVSEQVAKVKDAEVLLLRGELLPIVRIDDVLQLPKIDRVAAGPRPMSIVVIETGRRRYGLVVDRIVDSEEIVVKPLGRHVKGCTCLAGATILGDGHVALILDAAGIAAQANLATSNPSTSQGQNAQDDRGDPAHHAKTNTDAHDLLLFSTTPHDQFAIPMSLVARIERVPAHKIKIVGGRRLLQYRGSNLPLVRLEDHVQTRPMAEADRYYVVVFRTASREVGLLVAELDDVRQLTLDIDSLTFRERGIAGGFVVDETTMRLVDTVELAHLAQPEWFETTVAPTCDDESAPQILIAEDSSFFRQQLTHFFEEQGFQVIGCEDGQRAWDYLTNEAHEVRLVITDVEMPNMNGFELCRKIKQHEELGMLPVIALTSLTSEADVQRGIDAGMDDYQIKLDREQIMTVVDRLLPAKSNQPQPRRRPASAETASPCTSV